MNNKPYSPNDRRPIASRNTSWATSISRRLAQRGISPNAISTWSMIFAAIAALALVAISYVSDSVITRILWWVVLLGIQLGLLANLFDGMVAIETQTASPVGELFNEIPDRVSDTLMLLAWGLLPDSSLFLAVSAAFLALFVSYLRAMGAAAGAGQAFAGVMSKPKRMFVLSILCVLHALLPQAWLDTMHAGSWGLDSWGLLIICLGCLMTAWTRLQHIVHTLNAKAQPTPPSAR